MTFASTVYQGPYEKIGEANAAVAAWVRDNGYTYDGPAFNIYHISPHETKDPEQFVTEVCYPVKKADDLKTKRSGKSWRCQWLGAFRFLLAIVLTGQNSFCTMVLKRTLRNQ